MGQIQLQRKLRIPWSQVFSACVEIRFAPAIPANQRQRIHQHCHIFSVAFCPQHRFTFPRSHECSPRSSSPAHTCPPRAGSPAASRTPHTYRYNAAPPPAASRTAAGKAPRCGSPPQSPPTDGHPFPRPPPSKSSSPTAYPRAAPPDTSTSHPRQSPPPAAVRRLHQCGDAGPPGTGSGRTPPFLTRTLTAWPLT